MKKDFELEFESLWNLDGTEKASVDETNVRIMTALKEAGIVSPEFIVDEINSKKIFSTPLNKDDIHEEPGFDFNNEGSENPEDIKSNADKAIGELINGDSNPEQQAKQV